MAEHTKDELIAEIENARLRLRSGLEEFRRQTDVPARMKNSFTENKTLWLSGAGVAGWILSRLPARKKKVKVYVDKKSDGKIKELAEAGLIAGLLKFLFTLLRPAITSFATQKIADFAGGNHRWKK
jgi:hypothetical protein